MPYALQDETNVVTNQRAYTCAIARMKPDFHDRPNTVSHGIGRRYGAHLAEDLR